MALTFAYLGTTRAADRRRVEVELASASRHVNILIAVRDLPRGTKVESRDVKWVRGVKAHLPNRLIVNEQQVIGRETVADILAGEPIVSPRVAGHDSRRGSTTIRRGFVALAVGVDEVAGVAGGIRPGDRVDVMVSEEETGRTKLLFEFIRVLGVAGHFPFAAKDEAQVEDADLPTGAGTAVVLELKPREAVSLTEASENGSIRLALRAPE